MLYGPFLVIILITSIKGVSGLCADYKDKEVCTESIYATVDLYEMESNISGFIIVSTDIKRIVKITYTVENKDYNATLNVDEPYEKGDVISIKYNPKNPVECILNKTTN